MCDIYWVYGPEVDIFGYFIQNHEFIVKQQNVQEMVILCTTCIQNINKDNGYISIVDICTLLRPFLFEPFFHNVAFGNGWHLNIVHLCLKYIYT